MITGISTEVDMIDLIMRENLNEVKKDKYREIEMKNILKKDPLNKI